MAESSFPDRRKGNISFEPKLTLSGLISIITIAAGGIWFASQYDGKLSALADDVAELGQKVEDNRQFQIDQRVRVWNKLGQVESAVNNMSGEIKALTAVMTRMERQLDRMQSDGRASHN